MEPTKRPPMMSDAEDEKFIIHDRATNARINIRQAPDEMLARYQGLVHADVQMLMQQLQQIVLQSSLAAQQGAVISYEIDRRKRAAKGLLQ